MITVNKFKNLTGKQLLDLVSDKSDMVDINGEIVSLIPRTLPFCNQAEISSVDEATHISAQTRFMSASVLIKV